MYRILLIHADSDTLTTFTHTLGTAGHRVLTTSSGSDGLSLFSTYDVDLVIAGLRLPDRSGLDVLRAVRGWQVMPPSIILTRMRTAKDALMAMRLGATDVVDESIPGDELLRLIERVMARARMDREARAHRPLPDGIEAHAAARLSRALVRLVDCPRDPKTIAFWARWIAASPGALRNWCSAAGIPARRSLVFGRMLRAVLQSEGHSPENLLDVGDLRTLRRILRLGGFQESDGFPVDVEDFLERQTLIRDPEMLVEIRRALDQSHQNRESARLVSGARVKTTDHRGAP